MKVVNTQEVESQVSGNTDQLTVVDCFTTWCGPCKAIKPVLDKLSAEYTNVSFLAVDIDNNPDFAKKMNVRSVPTLLYFKNGEVVHTTRGLQREPDVRTLLETL
jgi:thioredoxin 1